MSRAHRVFADNPDYDPDWEKHKQLSSDMVNHPEHYTSDDGGIECIDAIHAALGLEGFMDYCRGNVLKYLWRAGRKGDAAEDLRKAAWYCERAAKELEHPHE